MNVVEFSGVTDSPASLLSESQRCGRCNATISLVHGICLQCLFQGALVDDPILSDTGFVDLLAEVQFKEAKWRGESHQLREGMNSEPSRLR